MSNSVFRDNVVIVTGASSGIGRELALLLAREGANLSLAARNTQRLEETAARCTESGAKALVVTTDVADEAQCKSLVERTVEEYGRVDTLINNAGFAQYAALEQLPDLEQFRRVMDVNFMGSVNCTYYALPHVKETKGRIVGVSSVLGRISAPRYTSYCASKYAMAGFFNSLRIELRSSGVSVTTVYPNFVVTEFAERVVKPDGNAQGPKGRRVYTKRTMTAETCARIIMLAAAKRKRQVVLTSMGKLAVLAGFAAPGLIDRMMSKGFVRKKE